jgi:hypothetical protein
VRAEGCVPVGVPEGSWGIGAAMALKYISERSEARMEVSDSPSRKDGGNDGELHVDS